MNQANKSYNFAAVFVTVISILNLMRVAGEERYVTLDMEDDDSSIVKKKRRKRKRLVGPMLHRPPVVNKPKVVDPEDLPKRARWTIIITAGFLLLTCMLLVGITLRMAPIIDQMGIVNLNHSTTTGTLETALES